MAKNKLCIERGELRHRVSIEQRARTSDGAGGHTAAWSEYTAAWCSISPYRGYQKFQAMQLETPITHKIKMRYQSGITTDMRIIFDSRKFDIKEVINVDERNLVLEILAVEGLLE